MKKIESIVTGFYRLENSKYLETFVDRVILGANNGNLLTPPHVSATVCVQGVALMGKLNLATPASKKYSETLYWKFYVNHSSPHVHLVHTLLSEEGDMLVHFIWFSISSHSLPHFWVAGWCNKRSRYNEGEKGSPSQQICSLQENAKCYESRPLQLDINCQQKLQKYSLLTSKTALNVFGRLFSKAFENSPPEKYLKFEPWKKPSPNVTHVFQIWDGTTSSQNMRSPNDRLSSLV